MGDRHFPDAGLVGAAAAAVATIAHQMAGDGLRLHLTFYNRQVAAVCSVMAELLGQVSFRGVRACENHEPTGFPIDPVNGAHGPWNAALSAAPFDLVDDMR